MTVDHRAQVAKVIDTMQTELVEMTADLIQFRTLRSTGEGYEACAEYLRRRLEAAEVEGTVIRVPDEEVRPLEHPESHYRVHGLDGPISPRFNVVGTRRGTGHGRSVHLTGHFDVVEPGPGWSGDPFEPRIADGRLVGRGACDMKSGLAMIVGAMSAIGRAKVRLPGDVNVSFTVDTHVCGDLGAGYVVKHGLGRSDRVIVADMSGVRRVLTGYRGQLWAEIRAEGQLAHGSTPFYGHSAIESMGPVIMSLGQLKERLLRITSASRVVPEEARHPSLVVTQIHGGSTFYLVAPDCRLNLDRRLIPEETVDQALGQIQEAIREAQSVTKGKISCRVLFSAPPVATGEDDPLVRTLQNNISAVTGAPAESLVHPAMMDLRWFVKGWGVPGVVYGPGDCGAGTGFLRKPSSEPDEYVMIADVVDATKVLALSLLDLTA